MHHMEKFLKDHGTLGRFSEEPFESEHHLLRIISERKSSIKNVEQRMRAIAATDLIKTQARFNEQPKPQYKRRKLNDSTAAASGEVPGT